jgi:hypothetical protein
MAVAVHNHSNTKDPNEFATPESFAAAIALSKYFKVNLDIGHFTAANYDPVATSASITPTSPTCTSRIGKRIRATTRRGAPATRRFARSCAAQAREVADPRYIEYEYRGTAGAVEK